MIPQQLKNQKFIKTKEKIPIEQDWQNTKNYEETSTELQEHINKHQSYGVLCGYNNLLVVDLDKEEVQQELLKISPFNKTFTVKTAGSGLYHFYFYTDKQPKSFKCLNNNKETVFDVQGIGKQVIGAGTLMSNGRRYETVNNAPILHVEYEWIKKVLEPYNTTTEQKNTATPQNHQKDPIIKEIKRRMSIKNYLSIIGIDTRKNPTMCPLGHPSKGNACFSYNEELWHCFHCESKGDIFHLVQQIEKCDFVNAIRILKEKIGIKEQKSTIVPEEEKKKITEDYKELALQKFRIFKSKDETLYELQIGTFKITLTPDEILGSSNFRKKFFNETGRLLPSIEGKEWVELVNHWMKEHGEMIDNVQDTSTESIVTECFIQDLQSFIVVQSSEESLGYGRLWYKNEEPEYFYVWNKTLDSFIKRHQFKINMTKLKVLVEDYIYGNSTPIRVGNKLMRFFKLKRSMLPFITTEKLTEAILQQDDQSN